MHTTPVTLLNLFDVKPKFTARFVCEAQILLCVNHSYALQVSLMSFSLPFFGCVRKLVLIKLQIPMFLKVLHTCSLFRPVVRITHLLPTGLLSRPAKPSCKSAEACRWIPIRSPKKCLKPQIFKKFSTVKICCFRPLVFWKVCKFGRSWCWENMFVIFAVFVLAIKWQQIPATSKQGTYQLVAKSRSY